MQIQHQQNAHDGEFFLLNETGEKVANLTYVFVSENKINANHTFVDQSLRGQGIADKLYQALVAFVRERGLELMASCSYIAKKWEREKE